MRSPQNCRPGRWKSMYKHLRRVGSTRWLRTPPRNSVELLATAVLTLQAAAAALSQRRAFVLKRDYVRVSPVPDAETGARPGPLRVRALFLSEGSAVGKSLHQRGRTADRLIIPITMRGRPPPHKSERARLNVLG